MVMVVAEGVAHCGKAITRSGPADNLSEGCDVEVRLCRARCRVWRRAGIDCFDDGGYRPAEWCCPRLQNDAHPIDNRADGTRGGADQVGLR